MKKYPNHFFKRALDATRDLILIKGNRSNILWANKAFRDYYNMSEQDLVDIIDGPQSDPDDLLQYIKDDQTVFESKTHLNIPTEDITDYQNNVHSFHTIKSPILDNQGVIQSIGISRLHEDSKIQTRKIDHTEAKKFSAPLRAISSTFPVPLILLDIKQRVINCSPLWNESFGPLTNISHETFFSDTFKTLRPLTPLIQKCMLTKHPQQKVLEINDKNQHKFYDFKLTPWYYPAGDEGGVTIVASDITLRIEREKKLATSNKELERFTYIVAHDLRSPLRAVESLSTWISSDSGNTLSQTSLTDLHTLRRRIQRMDSMLEALLEYSTCGTWTQKDFAIQVSNFTAEINHTLHPPNNYKIEWNCAALAQAASAVNLRTVLTHLVGNAIKHRQNIGNTCKITAHTRKHHLQIEVFNNGPNIPHEQHENIFVLFKTLLPKDQFETCGMGLALVQKIIENEGFSIEVRNPPGGGVCFSFDWPRKVL
ncbi:MAG: PAS domain-containing sensor histidine kinase [Zetaproteobacteria bacterium]|nr:PAS domain-containing sensor histidine kinase [Zetaproteobacteria bacterium]